MHENESSDARRGGRGSAGRQRVQELSHERLDEGGPELVRVRVRGLGAQGLHEPACQARAWGYVRARGGRAVTGWKPAYSRAPRAKNVQ